MTWTSHPHVWMTIRVAFYLLCAVGASMFTMWVLASIIGACVAASQRRAQQRRKAHDHRVGGVISP